MLKKRLITGTILSLAIIGLFIADNRIEEISALQDIMSRISESANLAGLLLALLAMTIAPFIAIELSAISNGINVRPNVIISWLLLELWICLFFFLPSSIDATYLLALFSSVFLVGFLLPIILSAKNKDLSGSVASASFTVATSTYVAVGVGFLLLIRQEHDALWILGIIAIVKMCDIGAFFIGCNFGKHKLIPLVSPKKTWEGLIGGLLVAMLTAIGLSKLNNIYLIEEPEISLAQASLLGLTLGLLGQLGDLLISVFKRDSRIKDTAAVLPGMGGVLDVIDSLLIVGPISYWLLQIV